MKAADSIGPLEQLVLAAVLALDAEAYGVTIHEKVNALSAPRSVHLSAVYVTLVRMEDKGLVSSWLSAPRPERGGRARRHYRLEAAGRRALRESMTTAKRMYETVSRAWGTEWKPARQS
jgi:DNA-binding PadR family transcriptional regulator